MSQRVALALCAGLLLGLMPGSALAKPTVDQQNIADGTGFSGVDTLAQTFTVGRTGTLTQIDLLIDESPAKSLTVHIKAVGATYPTGSDLATGSASVNVQAWYHFPLSKALSVKAGQKYAIIFSLGATGGVYGSTSGDKYPRGQALVEDPSWFTYAGTIDFDFKTYVAPLAPAPTPKPTAKPQPTSAPSASTAPSATPTSTPVPTTTPVPTATPVPFGLAHGNRAGSDRGSSRQRDANPGPAQAPVAQVVRPS